MFVTEKYGRVRVIPAGSTTPQVLYDLHDHVNKYSDRGLLGIAVDAGFTSNHYLYLLYTWEGSPGSDETLPKSSRLTRIQVNADNTLVNPSSPETVLLGTSTSQPCPAPSDTADCIPSDGRTHSIGTVRADGDGTLWVGSGDAAPDNAVDDLAFRTYDERSYAGKLLHIDGNGRGIAGHPLCPSDNTLTHVCTKIYAKGFRNPFRFTLRPAGGGPQVGDVGWSAKEEFDRVAPGKNYGWPCYEGAGHTSNYAQRSECSGTGGEYSREGTAAADTPPDYSYSHAVPPGETFSTGAIIGGPTYTGSGYPAGYLNDVFVGDYSLNFIRRLHFGAGGQVTATDFATGPDVFPVDIQIAPSGNLSYVDIAAGEVKEIVYTPGNRTPVARASADQTSGAAPLTVGFRGDTSSDPDGDPLTYDWDFGDGSTHSTAANPSYTYSLGNYTARLTVSDGQRTDTATVAIAAGNSPPTAAISAPTDNSSYRDGDTVQLSGSATDPQDGNEPSSRLSWHMELHHGNHIHFLTDKTGTPASFDTFTDHDADSYYTITLTATDAGGLTDSKTVTIRPRTINLTLTTSPTGAQLGYAGLTVTGPWNHVAAIGFQTSISATDQFRSAANGRIYAFSHWSDTSANLHNINVPATDTTYTAFYLDATPTARASAVPTSGPIPLPVAFRGDTSSDAETRPLTYDWDFGDGSTHSTAANPSHTYGTRGTYTARLTVTSVRGATDSAPVVVSASNNAPVASASGSPTSGQPPLQVTFRGSGSSDTDNDALSYAWDFGDGSGSSAADPVHTYQSPGSYSARLTVDDGHGATDSATVPVTVDSPPAAAAPPAALPDTPTAGPLPSSNGQAPDRQGPATSFDTRASAPGGGRLAGRTSDPAGVRKLQVALRTVRDRRPGCRWWSRASRALWRKRGSCSSPAWMTAALRPQAGGWRWSLSLGRAPPPGSYVLMLRAYDRLGNVSTKLGSRSQVTVRVPASRRKRRG